jgi:ABC-type transport system involved in multi-copper enzyme maturation permease subunit
MEILDHLLSAKFLFMFLICFVLILLSVYMGVSEYLEDKKIYDDDVAWDALAMQPPNTYSILLEGALKIHRPPQPLGALVKGVEDAAGRVSLTNKQEVSLNESKYESNPLTAVFGAFDLIFVVKIVLSLFVILLVHDTICGEREKGTLKLTLSNSVPRDRLLLGKAIGGYISLIVPLLIPLLLGLIYLSLHPQIVFTGEDWQRLGLIFFMFLLYLSVFFFLGLLVSSLTMRSATSLIVLLFIWSVWGIVVPKASVLIAGRMQPIPTSNEIYTQKALFSTQLSRELTQSMQQKQQELLKKYNVTSTNSPEYQEFVKAANEMSRELNQEATTKSTENNTRLDRDYLIRKDAQASLAKNISRISPASAVTFSATTLAGTGTDDYNRFWKAIMDFKPVITTWVSTNPDLRDEKGAYKQIDSSTLVGMPQPAIGPEKLDRLAVRILPDLVSMIVMIVILMGGAHFAFIRCDVR